MVAPRYVPACACGAGAGRVDGRPAVSRGAGKRRTNESRGVARCASLLNESLSSSTGQARTFICVLPLRVCSFFLCFFLEKKGLWLTVVRAYF